MLCRPWVGVWQERKWRAGDRGLLLSLLPLRDPHSSPPSEGTDSINNLGLPVGVCSLQSINILLHLNINEHEDY